MGAVETIERVLASGVLTASLVFVPARGATAEELRELSVKLPRALSERHEELLRRWNGLNLDVIRLYGASPTAGELRGLLESQRYGNAAQGAIVFGDDPSGFVYIENKDGQIAALDSSLGTQRLIASSLDDFFGRLVFGSDAQHFAGKAWLEELKSRGIV